MHKLSTTITTPSRESYLATLDRRPAGAYDNAELTITIYVRFVQINPISSDPLLPGVPVVVGFHPDSDDVMQPVMHWTTFDWNKFVANFKSKMEKYWDGKFWLLNDFYWGETKVRGVSYFPNLWCRFRIEPASKLVAPHVTLKVVRVNPKSTFRESNVLVTSRSNAKELTNWTSRGRPIRNIPLVHEAGHWMGLDHVDVGKLHCPLPVPAAKIFVDHNHPDCYGLADPDMKTVMGYGLEMREKFADPWRRAACQLTGNGEFGNPHAWAAKMRRHYPRTSDEIFNAKRIITRPNRG